MNSRIGNIGLLGYLAAFMGGSGDSVPTFDGTGMKASPELRAELDARKRGPQWVQDRIIAKAEAKRARRRAARRAS